MNKFIREELEKVTTPMPSWDENTLQLVIPKRGSLKAAPVNTELIIGQQYSLYIEDYIINPPEGFTLAANWNNGTNPPCQRMSGKLTQIMGKMLYFTLISADGSCWEGWLPRKGFTIC